MKEISRITEKDFHHYAYDEDGKLVFLRHDKTHKITRKNYYCIDCGEVMRPVQGNKRTWHFRHKNENPQCNKESYIHKLGKRLIKERFDNSDTFIVSYHRQLCCPEYGKCKIWLPSCKTDEFCKINLKELFDTCQEEECGNNSKYRADLLLTHSKHPERSIYLEIAYRHRCELEKITSGIKIIEIEVNEDWDFDMSLEEPKQISIDYDNSDKPYKKDIPSVRFYNFERRVPTNIPITKPIDLYVIFNENGVCYPRTFIDKCDIFKSKTFPSVIEYMLAVPKGTFSDQNKIFIYGMVKAISNGIPIKCCFLCSRFHKGWDGCKRNGAYLIDIIKNNSYDLYKEASMCRDYKSNNARINNLIVNNDFIYIPCYEWKRNETKSK